MEGEDWGAEQASSLVWTVMSNRQATRARGVEVLGVVLVVVARKGRNYKQAPRAALCIREMRAARKVGVRTVLVEWVACQTRIATPLVIFEGQGEVEAKATCSKSPAPRHSCQRGKRRWCMAPCVPRAGRCAHGNRVC